jgi:hypothetical protein
MLCMQCTNVRCNRLTNSCPYYHFADCAHGDSHGFPNKSAFYNANRNTHSDTHCNPHSSTYRSSHGDTHGIPIQHSNVTHGDSDHRSHN